MEELKKYIREVPDYPVKGVSFKDISPLLQNRIILRGINMKISEFIGVASCGEFIFITCDYVLGIDARGFIMGSSIATTYHSGFIMARKIGKLPEPTVKSYYNSEYSKDGLCISSLLDLKGKKVHIHDDVLATGALLIVLLTC